ncbi:DUF4037 domain-containing protein [Streptomyces sp. PT12]|uniref:DUF4037 domain-containing protein n=1 Tax=Streptomyces sp. PT12 TaxID=1510197 RepID=UPI001C686956|nr:DUF4037 domain-containing protein [Streptomyces sp. PT12]
MEGVNGRDLAGEFYAREVRPLLGDVPHAAALLGDGSEVLGFDDGVSPDHDFGPRVQVLVGSPGDADAARAALGALPEAFEGFRVRFAGGDHAVEVATAPAFFTARLGVDPAAGMGLADWLLTPTQRLATMVEGPVFHDPAGELARRRAALRWYPADVWRYVLAAAWLRVSQEEAFIGRAGSRGDELGSAVVAARVARDLVRLAFLVERRWAPYGKWLGTAFARLPLAPRVGPHLDAALRAGAWREREAAVCRAASELAAATNRLGLAEELDPGPRRFHARDIRVLAGERFTEALVARITDPGVGALVDRLGRRADGSVGRLPGAID